MVPYINCRSGPLAVHSYGVGHYDRAQTRPNINVRVTNDVDGCAHMFNLFQDRAEGGSEGVGGESGVG